MKRARQFLQAAGQQFNSVVHRVVSLLERERRAQLLVVLAVSLVIAAVVSESVMSTRRARERWTSNVTVVVLTSWVRAGERLTTNNTTIVSVPRALLADDALRTLPPGTHTRIALSANTALTASVTVPAPEAVVIPAGWRVVALPTDVATPVVHSGDRVDLIVGNSVAAPDCIVVSTEPLSIAVPHDVAPRVVAGARLAEVSVISQPSSG